MQATKPLFLAFFFAAPHKGTSMCRTPTGPCRYDMGCWRPLCTFRHSGPSRAARWAAVWGLLAKMEEEAGIDVDRVAELGRQKMDAESLTQKAEDRALEAVA